MPQIKGSNIDWYFINLAHRTDRLQAIGPELAKAGITATRFEALTYDDFNGPPHDLLTLRHCPGPGGRHGNVGAYLSHLALWQHARSQCDSADTIIGVLEDDPVFCDDFQQRLSYIEKNFEREWDIFFLSAFYHVNPAFWHKNSLGRDFELTDTKYIHRMYGAFMAHAYLINPVSIDKLYALMRTNMHRAYAIDHGLVQLQPSLRCYCFSPGCVFQLGDTSDSSAGPNLVQQFYDKCGKHIFARRLEDFDYDNYNWAEGQI